MKGEVVPVCEETSVVTCGIVKPEGRGWFLGMPGVKEGCCRGGDVFAICNERSVRGDEFVHFPVGGGTVEHAASFAEVSAFLPHLCPVVVLVA